MHSRPLGAAITGLCSIKQARARVTALSVPKSTQNWYPCASRYRQASAATGSTHIPIILHVASKSIGKYRRGPDWSFAPYTGPLLRRGFNAMARHLARRGPPWVAYPGSLTLRCRYPVAAGYSL